MENGGGISPAAPRCGPPPGRATLLGDLTGPRLAVDLEGQVVDLARALRVVVDLGADLDPGQPHVLREPTVILHDPVEHRLDVDLAVERGHGAVVDVEVEEAPLAVGPGVALV